MERHNRVGIGLFITFLLILVIGLCLPIKMNIITVIGSLGLFIAIIVWIVSSVKATKKLEESVNARKKLEGLKKGDISLFVIGFIIILVGIWWYPYHGIHIVLWIFLAVGIPLSLTGGGLWGHFGRIKKRMKKLEES